METVFISKHFLLERPRIKENFSFLWEKLKAKVRELNLIDEDGNVNFITKSDQHHKNFLLLASLQLPLDNTVIYSVDI